MAMEAFYVAPRLGMAMADVFLDHAFGEGYEECEDVDYEAYKANGFQVVEPREAPLGPEPRGLAS